jgi:hypothetical protein
MAWRRCEVTLNPRRGELEIDIPCDPTQIDHTGLPWAFLDESDHPERIVEGAIVITGDADDPVVARVVSLTERPSGTKVHLELPPNGSVDTP